MKLRRLAKLYADLQQPDPAWQRKAVKAPTAKSVKGEQDEMVAWSSAQFRAFLDWGRDVLLDDVHALWWLHCPHGHVPVRGARVALERRGPRRAHRIKIRRAIDTGKPAARRSETKGMKSGRARVLDIDAATDKALRQWRTGADTTARSERTVSDVHAPMFTRRVAKARKALGSDALLEITLHDLRHTHATVLLETREKPKMVQERLGHTTITTTMAV